MTRLYVIYGPPLFRPPVTLSQKLLVCELLLLWVTSLSLNVWFSIFELTMGTGQTDRQKNASTRCNAYGGTHNNVINLVSLLQLQTLAALLFQTPNLLQLQKVYADNEF